MGSQSKGMEVKTSIKSFTIIELLVVLLITSIIMGIVFSVHQFVNKQFHEKSLLERSNSNINFLEKKLWREFNNSICYIGESKFQLNFKKGNLISEFVIEEDFVLINKDTFDLYVENFFFYNKGESVIRGRVDALKLIIPIKNNIKREIFVYKQEDVESLLNDNIDYGK
ncbi:type II secretion system protein [Wenyingzhuangia sp. IMCC45533]